MKTECYLSVISKCDLERCNGSVFCSNHELLRNDKDTFIEITSSLLKNSRESNNRDIKKYNAFLLFDFIIYNKIMAKNINDTFQKTVIKKINELDNDINAKGEFIKYKKMLEDDLEHKEYFYYKNANNIPKNIIIEL